MQINQQALRAAQDKAREAIAQRNGDKWIEAHQDIKKAINHPWYQRGKRQ